MSAEIDNTSLAGQEVGLTLNTKDGTLSARGIGDKQSSRIERANSLKIYKIGTALEKSWNRWNHVNTQIFNNGKSDLNSQMDMLAAGGMINRVYTDDGLPAALNQARFNSFGIKGGKFGASNTISFNSGAVVYTKKNVGGEVVYVRTFK